jgi:hypothetical protein
MRGGIPLLPHTFPWYTHGQLAVCSSHVTSYSAVHSISYSRHVVILYSPNGYITESSLFPNFGKVKVKLSLCFNLAPRHVGVLGSGDMLPRILDLGTRWRWVVSFTPGHFTPRERAPGTHWIGSWMGPRAGLDTVLKRKIPSPCRTQTPDHPARSPALYHWTIPYVKN